MHPLTKLPATLQTNPGFSREQFGLSERDRWILHNLAHGKQGKFILAELGISKHTYNPIISRLKKFFGAKTIPHLIFLSIQKGYIECPVTAPSPRKL